MRVVNRRTYRSGRATSLSPATARGTRQCSCTLPPPALDSSGALGARDRPKSAVHACTLHEDARVGGAWPLAIKELATTRVQRVGRSRRHALRGLVARDDTRSAGWPLKTTRAQGAGRSRQHALSGLAAELQSVFLPLARLFLFLQRGWCALNTSSFPSRSTYFAPSFLPLPFPLFLCPSPSFPLSSVSLPFSSLTL